KAHFVGNSMGGATSVCFAVNNPDRIGKLILMGAAGGGVSIFQPNPPEGIKLLSQVYKSMTRETMRRLIEVFVYDSSFLTEELLEQRFQTASNPELTQAYLASTQGAPDLTAIAHKITAPTLIVYGRDDRVVPLDNMLRYLWTIPNARLHVFSQCGHWAQYEKAEEFNRLVEDFLTH
ncbi:MAG TPA: alpha/beta hydrolase, partial [Chloroflexota bacterium]|nr:alpha/beta hydrolase [Chloroflexota bacterium]